MAGHGASDAKDGPPRESKTGAELGLLTSTKCVVVTLGLFKRATAEESVTADVLYFARGAVPIQVEDAVKDRGFRMDLIAVAADGRDRVRLLHRVESAAEEGGIEQGISVEEENVLACGVAPADVTSDGGRGPDSCRNIEGADSPSLSLGEAVVRRVGVDIGDIDEEIVGWSVANRVDTGEEAVALVGPDKKDGNCGQWE